MAGPFAIGPIKITGSGPIPDKQAIQHLMASLNDVMSKGAGPKGAPKIMFRKIDSPSAPTVSKVSDINGQPKITIKKIDLPGKDAPKVIVGKIDLDLTGRMPSPQALVQKLMESLPQQQEK